MADLFYHVQECQSIEGHVIVIAIEIDKGDDALVQTRVCEDNPTAIARAKRDISIAYCGEERLEFRGDSQEIKAAPVIPSVVWRDDQGRVMVFIGDKIAYVPEKLTFDDVLNLVAHNGIGLAHISYSNGPKGCQQGRLRHGGSVYTQPGMQFCLVERSK